MRPVEWVLVGMGLAVCGIAMLAWYIAATRVVCHHFAQSVDERRETAICVYCHRTYPYEELWGHYPGVDVDLNMPTDDPRRYHIRQVATNAIGSTEGGDWGRT